MEQKNLMICFKELIFASCLSAVLFTSACGKKEKISDSSSDTDVSYEESHSDEVYCDETYPETLSVYGVNETGSRYFGIMHAVLLDAQKDPESGEILYTFQDKNDRENAWAISEIDIGSVNADMKKGNELCLIFNGDIINDSENVKFIAILPEDDYIIKRTEGNTLNNVMSSFRVKTKDGKEISFIKDNCLMEDGVMQQSEGEKVVVYYAEGTEEGINYPLKIYHKK